jgi:hypothetical protein
VADSPYKINELEMMLDDEVGPDARYRAKGPAKVHNEATEKSSREARKLLQIEMSDARALKNRL